MGNSNEGGKKGRFKHAANSLPAYKILPWPQFIRQAPQDGPQALLHFHIAYAQAESATKMIATCRLCENSHQPLHGEHLKIRDLQMFTRNC